MPFNRLTLKPTINSAPASKASAQAPSSASRGVMLGNALSGNSAPYSQPVQPQRAFAPQMQMPYNQPIQRAYSGMQFGSTPNPAQPPQMPPQQRPVHPQMMPQAQPQNIQNQFARQFGPPPPQNGMGPQQFPTQLTPDLERLVKGMGRTYI